MPTTTEKIPSLRNLILLMTAVVVCFLLASILAQVREGALESRVNELVGNAIPSIQDLSRARTSLRRAMDDIYALKNGDAKTKTSTERQLTADVNDVQYSASSYLNNPYFPREVPLAENMIADQKRFLDSLNVFLLSRETHRDGQPIYQMTRNEADLLDRSLARLISFNTDESRRLGLEISKIRMESLYIIGLFDLISIGLAIFAAVLGARKLRATLGTLQARTEELEVFGGRVAHDLKNPLQSILLASGMGSRVKDPEKMERELQRIQGTAQRMNETIDGLLQFAKSGGKPVENSVTELGTALEKMFLAVKPDAEKAGIKMVVDDFQRPLRLACPEGVTDSVISNLIRNAMKYVNDAGQSQPQVFIHVKNFEESARIEIEDNGPGIEPGKEKTIFLPYVRGTNMHQGIGLGLATVKRLVEAYGGKVGVISKWHEGSTFWVEMPKTS